MRKARNRSRVICSCLFVGCPPLLYAVVGAYPINILPDFFFFLRTHLKMYTFSTTHPADVICVIRLRKKTILSLYQVDVQAKHARNEKHFNSIKRNNIKRRIRVIYYYWYYNTRSSPADVKQTNRSRAYHRKIIATTYRLEMMPILEIIQTLQTSRYNRSRKITSSKYNIFATSPLSRSASIRVHVEVRNG